MAFFVQLSFFAFDGIDLTFMKINLRRGREPEDFTFKTSNFQEQLQVVPLPVFCWFFFCVCVCGLIFLFDKVVTS